MKNNGIGPAFRIIRECEDRIERIKEEQIKPIKEEISAEWKHLKAYCEEENLDFKVVKKLYALWKQCDGDVDKLEKLVSELEGISDDDAE